MWQSWAHLESFRPVSVRPILPAAAGGRQSPFWNYRGAAFRCGMRDPLRTKKRVPESVPACSHLPSPFLGASWRWIQMRGVRSLPSHKRAPPRKLLRKMVVGDYQFPWPVDKTRKQMGERRGGSAVAVAARICLGLQNRPATMKARETLRQKWAGNTTGRITALRRG